MSPRRRAGTAHIIKASEGSSRSTSNAQGNAARGTQSPIIVVSSDDEDAFSNTSPRKGDHGPGGSPVKNTPLSGKQKFSQGRPAAKLFSRATFPRNRELVPVTEGKRNVSSGTVITISSSDSNSDFEAVEPSRSSANQDETLLYSPVKTSHDVIDLTFSSDEDELHSDSEADEDKVVSLLEDSPSPTPLKRLRKGSRFPDPVSPDLSTLSLDDEPRTGSPSPRNISGYGLSDPFSDTQATRREPKLPSRLPSRSSSAAGSSGSESDKPRRPAPRPRPQGQPTRSKGSGTESDSNTPPTKAVQTPRAGATKKGKTPRVSKKALQAAEQTRREAYAEQLFKDLNTTVFDGGLPESTQLKWSNRLLTTAGRARWRKSRDGSQTTEIELATKVLDCDERIRNTLSHEMCHLACWIINGDPKEGHGRIFKAWAAKVSRKRPDITVSTRHNYEINYPYEWECDNCAKIYGRYSKSIKPEECRCGTCKVGKLVPLFKTRALKPPKSKVVNNAAAKSNSQSVVSSLTNALLDLTLESVSQDDSVRQKLMPGASKTVKAAEPILGSDIETQLEALTRDMAGRTVFDLS